jgi:NADH-quinone oxidoreductase subunit N
MAIPQRNLKRLLAYSSISQAGYILVGFVGEPVAGMGSVLFYLLVYTFTNIGAFAVVLSFAHVMGSEDLEDYSGLAQRDPLMALTFLLALLSLAGIPPLAGFVGKFYLFYAAMKNGYLWLVIAAALNSTVSLYYYLLVLKRMYIFDPKKAYPRLVLPRNVRAALYLSLAGILALGIFPRPVMDLVTAAVKGLFQIP